MVRYKNSIFQFVCHPSKMVCVQTRRRLCLYIFVSDNDRGLPLSPSVTAVDNDLRSLARTLHVANPPPTPPPPHPPPPPPHPTPQRALAERHFGSGMKKWAGTMQHDTCNGRARSTARDGTPIPKWGIQPVVQWSSIPASPYVHAFFLHPPIEFSVINAHRRGRHFHVTVCSLVE